MDLISATTFQDIRAALGVSEDEIDDATLSLDVYALNLEAEMRDFGPTFFSDFQGVLLKALADRSASETWFLQMTKLFATYAVANQLAASLPLFSPKEITDGKASVTRYASNPYLDVIKAVSVQYNQARQRLETAYAGLKATTRTARATPVYLGRGPAGYDPVTGA
jgi:hypothetical protein